MTELIFETQEDDLKSKKYWLFLYKCRKNHVLIQAKIKELHKELMDYIETL